MKDFSFTFFAWLFTLPVLAVTIVFAIYNAGMTDVVVSPFRDPVNLPLYVPAFAALAFGFLFGSIMTWAAGGRGRKERRDLKKEIRRLEKQVTELEDRQRRMTMSPTTAPALISGNAFDYVR